MFGPELGMLAQAVPGAFDPDDDGMVEQSVEQRGGNDGIVEDLAPFGKTAVGDEHYGTMPVKGVY